MCDVARKWESKLSNTSPDKRQKLAQMISTRLDAAKRVYNSMDRAHSREARRAAASILLMRVDLSVCCFVGVPVSRV